MATTLKGVGAVVLGAAAIFGLLVLVTPEGDAGPIGWTATMIEQGWMAWTLATATFFLIIAFLLATMTVIASTRPEQPRVGALGIETTRGDRLFVTLLGSAWINIAWLGLADMAQWIALVVCAAWAAFVFRFV